MIGSNVIVTLYMIGVMILVVRFISTPIKLKNVLKHSTAGIEPTTFGMLAQYACQCCQVGSSM